MRTTTLFLSLTALAALGCTDKPSVPDIASTTFAPSLNVDLPSMTKTPTGLYYKDLVTGGGAVVATGQHVSIHYVGNLPDGTQFDANAAPATAFSFQLGANQVIPGFDEGVTGMHVGGKRQLIIPPSLGYGSQTNGPIPGNSILVFTIDLVSAS